MLSCSHLGQIVLGPQYDLTGTPNSKVMLLVPFRLSIKVTRLSAWGYTLRMVIIWHFDLNIKNHNIELAMRLS